MASIYDDIRTVLETTLSNVSGIPDIAWENVQYSPTTGSSFVRPQMMPTIREPAVRGLNPQQYYQGLFRVTCFVPDNAGPGAADDLADKVIDAFEATTDLTVIIDDLFIPSGSTRILTSTGDVFKVRGETTVSIRYAEREAGQSMDNWYMVPVNIGWYIYN